MRVYLDNCCYNRPFDDQTQTKVRVETICKLAIQLMMATGRTELRVRGFDVLAKAFGDVGAERFIALTSAEPFDYTEWRRNNLFVGETVDSIMDAAEAMEGRDGLRVENPVK